MRSCILVLLALLGAASANTGTLLMSCPEDWILFHTFYEVSCLKIMPEPKLFEEAFKSCHEIKSRLLSFSHRMDKVYFINKMIIDHIAKDPKASSHWFYDHIFGSPNIDALPKPEEWMVINPNTEFSKVALQPNSTAVARNFVCEAPAHPAAQRPQFQLEPEHLFLTDLLVKPTAETPKEHAPFIATFNCLAYGIPKPTIEWHTVIKAENQSLISQLINAKVITDHKEIKNPSTTEATIFILQRDCSTPNKCPANAIQERSQLVVVNPQFLDLNKKIACVAKNDFGSVLSREAKIFVTKMGEFVSKEEKVTVKSGISAIIHNAIKTEPDAAAADCYRVINPADPKKDVPIEELNRALQGAIQMSKATFDMIIDSARLDDAGEYKCRARLHNGRIGHVTREKTISLKVEPCVKTDGCDLEAKAVEVAQGYPAILSMNPMDNHVIRAGDDFLLECPCIGKRRPDEQLTVNWNLRNSTDMSAMAIPILPQGSALLIPRASKTTHSGTYYCQCVRGQEKSDWRSVEVNVLPSTEPVGHKEILTVKAGSKESILCHVQADLPGLGVVVEALHGTQSLADYLATTGDSRLQLSQDNPSKLSIIFNDVKESDSGIYGCRVTINYFGKWVESDTYYTTVVVTK